MHFRAFDYHRLELFGPMMLSNTYDTLYKIWSRITHNEYDRSFSQSPHHRASPPGIAVLP